MKKRVFAFFIVLSMAVLLCACQGKDQKDSDIQITDTAQQESVTGRRQNEVAKIYLYYNDILYVHDSSSTKTVQQPPCLTFGFLIMNVLAKLLFQVTKYRIVIWKQAALMPELSCTAKMII